ncbi:MAG: lipoate--protein ligase [Mycoplasmoidaceae bacterium]
MKITNNFHIYVSESNDPYYNLSLEEYLTKNIFSKYKIPIIFLWRNENTIVIGKNQVAEFEIDLNNAIKDKVKIVKRLSGGGAVFHDLGNFCFSFIVENEKQAGKYELFLNPIIEFLKKYKINAKVSGKNDLAINNVKISGNAQYVWKNVLVHHGTILFNACLPAIKKYLTINPIKTQSKVQRSQITSVDNIINYLEKEIETEEFFKKFIDYFKLHPGSTYKTIENDNQLVNEIYKDKYSKKEWTFNHPYNLSKYNAKRFDGGTITLWLNIENNLIEKILFEGDFLAIEDHSKMLDKFINQKLEINNIKSILNKIDLQKYFGKISSDELLELFFNKK